MVVRVPAGTRPGLTLEKEWFAAGFSMICGVDEAGRGPLCGPVVAGAVILSADLCCPASLDGLDDSKRLSAAQRTLLASAIFRDALATGIGLASVAEIDQLNIRRATLLAMSRAVAALSPAVPAHHSPSEPFPKPGFILIDGRDLPDSLPCPARAVIGGDRISASIAAASILAKTHRDAIMTRLAGEHPGYGWDRNAGYPTAEHLRALEKLGITPQHRLSYAPVAKMLEPLPPRPDTHSSTIPLTGCIVLT